MDDPISDETKPLIQSAVSEEANNGDSIPFDPDVKLPKRKWIVEPLVVMFIVALMGQMPVVSQYIYFRVGQTFNITQNSTRAYQCNVSESSSPNSTEKTLVNKMQNEASNWSLYCSVINSSIALVMTLFYASSSDYFGRKITIFISVFGTFLHSAISLSVIAFELPLYVFIIANAVGGFSGGFGTLFASVFAYLADTTSKNSRPIRIAIVEGMFGVGGTLVELGIGWWIKVQGYLLPHLACTCITLCAVLYVTFFVPEVRRAKKGVLRQNNMVSLLLWKPIQNIASLFKMSDNGSGVIYALILLTLCLFATSFMGSSAVLSLFEMNYPFCLDSVYIGYFNAAKIAAYQIGMVLAVKLLHPHLKPLGLATVGLVSSASSYCLLAFATSTTFLFIVPCVGIFSMLPIPMLRAHASQMAPQNKQGAIFAGIGVAEVASNLIGSIAFLTIYKETLSWFAGFVFLLIAGFVYVGLIIAIIIQALEATIYKMKATSLIAE